MFYAKIPLTDKPMWRPWALSTPYLCLLISLCVCLLISSEIVAASCALNGCRALGKFSNGNIPSESRFLYSQVPAAFSIALGLLWILPYHDICRLEPYFRMSGQGGERAGESLFLKYPYEIVALVPILALKKKHYEVSLSATILLLMNFLIVPFVANILNLKIVPRTFNGTTTLSSFSIPTQNVSTSTSFSAYSYAWALGPPTPFITDNYTLLPVGTNEESFTSSENWTVETTMFEAELKCTEGTPSPALHLNNTLSLNITSKDGKNTVRLCDAGAVAQNRAPNLSEDQSCDVATGFITPWTSISWQIVRPGLPTMYMYAWASGTTSAPNTPSNFTFPGPISMTALFCVPEYYSQKVNATIMMPAGTVLNVVRIGQRTNNASLPGFDRILDGNYLQTLPPSETRNDNAYVQLPVRFGYPTESVVDVSMDLLSRFGPSRNPIISPWFGRSSASNVYMETTDSLASFSLFSQQNATLSELLNATTLQTTIERGLKMLFGFAMAEVVRNTSTTRIPVVRMAQGVSITVNKQWVWVARIGLSVTALLATLLLFLLRRRPCKLYGEPNSMAVSLRLLSTSPALCAAMRYAEFYHPKLLSLMMDANDLFFKLELDTENQMCSSIRVMRGTGASSTIRGTCDSEEVLNPNLLACPPHTTPVKTKKPWAMAFSTSMSCYPPALAVLLIVLFAYSRINDGFLLNVDPTAPGSKLLYIHLPLAAVTVLGSLLVDLGSQQCMMGPYKTLETGKARYSKSLAVDYDKYPPHFQLHSAVINGEYTVAAISVAIILCNLLSVAVVGLFPIAYEGVTTPRSHNIRQPFTIPRQDMYFELEKALITNYNTPWTTPGFYIDPPYDPTPVGEGDYNTIGFGIDITCTPVQDDRITFPCSSYDASYSGCDMWNFVTITDPCGMGSKPFHVQWEGSCNDFVIACPHRIIAIWEQNMKFNVTPPSSQPGPTNHYNHVAINCSLTDNVRRLKAKVDKGKVLSLVNISPIDRMHLASLYPSNTSDPDHFLSSSFVDVLNSSIERDAPVLYYHPIARINYLMALLNSNVTGKPANLTHVPNPAVAARAFEGVMRSMFALQLQASADDVFSHGIIPVQGGTFTYRMHVDPPTFAVSLAILLFSSAVIVAVYYRQNKTVEGHIPWTLAEKYSHMYESNVKDDMAIVRELNLEEIRRQNEEWNRRYAFGKYPTRNRYGVYRTHTTEDLQRFPSEAWEGC